MHGVSSRAVTIFGGVLAFGSASAQDTTCQNFRLQDFMTLRIAVVTVERALFRDARGRATGAYVVKGDRVVQGPAVHGRRCSYFFGAQQEVSGFLNEAQASAVPVLPLASGRWVRDEDAELIVTSGGQVSGDALWHTPGGSVNLGRLEGVFVRRGPIWAYKSLDARDPCRVNVLNLGSRLLVGDNLQCGGWNVTFNGVYRRAP